MTFYSVIIIFIGAEDDIAKKLLDFENKICCLFNLLIILVLLHEKEKKQLKNKKTGLWCVQASRIFNFIESRAKNN